MLKKLLAILSIVIFLSGCHSSNNTTTYEIKDVMNFDYGEIRFVQKPKNEAETVVIHELINKFGVNKSAFQDINVIDIRSYFTIDDLKHDEIDTYKIGELEEIFNAEKHSIIVYILYDYKLSNETKIDTLNNFSEGLTGEYFILTKERNYYKTIYGNFKEYIPVVNKENKT